MNEELKEAIEVLAQSMEGNAAAQKAVQDALISTLLKHLPPLAGPFLEILELTEDHYRLHITEDAHYAHAALTNHLTHIRTLVEHLRAR